MIGNRSSRQLSKLFKLILFLISIAFASFLLQAGSLVIKNLPRVAVGGNQSDYLDKTTVEKIDDELETLKINLEMLKITKNTLIANHDGVAKRYSLEKERYNSQLASRYVTKDSKENSKVNLARDKLEEILQELQGLKSKIAKQDIDIANKESEIARHELEKKGIYKEAEKQRKASQNTVALKAFLIRLSFVLPLLAIAMFFFSRYRNSNYWPFVYGWGYFSLYAFFIELVPYLPSYGGYARSIVGIILCVVIGKFTIQKLNAYLENKRNLELEDEGQRREKLKNKESNLELAFEKINKFVCPSCDRKLVKEDSKFCSFCGLCIKKQCQGCNTLQISFNQYCQECGLKQ